MMSITTSPRPLLGIFLPTGNGGFSISTHPRTTTPTWDYNRRVALFAEAAGFDFLLAGARWTTLGGALDFQGHRFESMTIMTALAAVTQRIRLFPTIHTHVYHPVVAARMVNDANRISGGRCGINVVSGWVQSDFTMFGVEPKPPEERLAYNTEWLTLLKRAWREPNFDFEGTYFRVHNGYLEPKPCPMPPICKAGESPQSRELVIREADWLFLTLPHDPDTLRTRVADMKAEAARLGRQIRILSYGFVLCRDTRQEALRVRDQILAAGDPVAATNMARQRGWGPSADDPEELRSIMLSLGTRPFIGTPASIVDALQAYFATGLDGILFTYYDYELDLHRFADEILPHL
jgi:alkanesulfonate monooxygenase SsuD/methylene tetrahydromethanopterin reductase-like flavin-dependent oxidoreductase (luciferase family)